LKLEYHRGKEEEEEEGALEFEDEGDEDSKVVEEEEDASYLFENAFRCFSFFSTVACGRSYSFASLLRSSPLVWVTLLRLLRPLAPGVHSALHGVSAGTVICTFWQAELKRDSQLKVKFSDAPIPELSGFLETLMFSAIPCWCLPSPPPRQPNRSR